MHELCLQWVNVNGTIHHVSEYAELEPWQRPDANCPMCGRSVILKLGDIRTHHAAHYEGAICATTQPETVIHLNSKYHLQQVLRSKDSLLFSPICTGIKRGSLLVPCPKKSKRNIAFIQGWDQVEVEWSYGQYRLDLALLKGEKVIGAIEILVTHASEKGKLDFLNKNSIAWMEVEVTPDFYTPPTTWSGETPLEPKRYNESLIPVWHCEHCQKLQQEIEDAKEKALQQEKERRKKEKERQKKREFASQFDTLQIRVIDFYYPSGKNFRKLYLIQIQHKQGNKISAELIEHYGRDWKHLSVEHPPITNNSYENLKKALEQELDKASRPNWMIDRSYKWETPVRNYPLKEYFYPDTRPFKYEWVDNKWQKKVPKEEKAQQRPPWRGYGIEIPYPSSQANEPGSKSPTLGDVLDSLFKEYTCTVCGKLTRDWVSGNGKDKTCLCRDCSDKQQRQ